MLEYSYLTYPRTNSFMVQPNQEKGFFKTNVDD